MTYRNVIRDGVGRCVYRKFHAARLVAQDYSRGTHERFSPVHTHVSLLLLQNPRKAIDDSRPSHVQKVAHSLKICYISHDVWPQTNIPTSRGDRLALEPTKTKKLEAVISTQGGLCPHNKAIVVVRSTLLHQPWLHSSFALQNRRKWQ